MDDLTSGFNIGTNYTLNPQFNEMTGFTEKDVRDMLEYYSINPEKPDVPLNKNDAFQKVQKRRVQEKR